MNQPAPVGHNNPPVERTRDTVIMEWQAEKEKLDAAKSAEAKLRKEAIELTFPNKLKPGMNKFELGAGYELKATGKLNYKITKNETVDPADYSHLPQICAKLNQEVAQNIIRWKPELNESLYKKLTKEEQAIVDEFLIITDGSPTLELKAPKEKK